jgi:antitoxin PrlF
MITSKITSKGQTTVPQPVRTALKLAVGDELTYEIRGDRVVLGRAEALVGADPFTLFEEWSSEADRKGYANL